MEQRTFNVRLAKRLEIDNATATSLSDTLISLLCGLAGNLDTVAIPGFGTFTPVKTDEYVSTDAEGNRTLMPPSIKLTFKPGSRLKKSTSPRS